MLEISSNEFNCQNITIKYLRGKLYIVYNDIRGIHININENESIYIIDVTYHPKSKCKYKLYFDPNSKFLQELIKLDKIMLSQKQEKHIYHPVVKEGNIIIMRDLPIPPSTNNKVLENMNIKALKYKKLICATISINITLNNNHIYSVVRAANTVYLKDEQINRKEIFWILNNNNIFHSSINVYIMKKYI